MRLHVQCISSDFYVNINILLVPFLSLSSPLAQCKWKDTQWREGISLDPTGIESLVTSIMNSTHMVQHGISTRHYHNMK